MSSFLARYWHLLLSALILVLVVVLFILPWPADPLILDDVLENDLVYSNKFDNTGKLQNQSADRNGTPASALLLNGIDDKVIADGDFNVDTDFSICFWMKALRRDTVQMLMLKGENCPDGSPHFVGLSFEVRILDTNKLYAKIVAPGGNHTDEYIEMQSEQSVPRNQWTFVAIRYDNSAKRFNLDLNQLPQNIKQVSRTTPSNFSGIFQSDSPLKLGADEDYCGFQHKFSSHYHGYMDDVLILGRRVSDRELGLIAGTGTSDTFWERKSVAIKISIALLAIAALLAGVLKWGNVIIESIKRFVSAVLAKYDFEKLAIFCAMACGAILAVLQFAVNPGLWTDEILLALNIVTRTPLELLRPLDFYVVGPILFLEIEKLFSLIVPDTDMGLRLLPLLAYLAASYFFYRVLAKIHTNKYAILVGIALFAFNSPLIYYSSEVKQYMVDVMVVTLIYFLLLREYKDVKTQILYVGVAGMICIWLSNISPIILLTAGVFLVFQHGIRDAKIRLNLTFMSAAWALTFGVYYYFFIWHNPATEPMLAYWNGMNVFAPKNIFSRAFFDFLIDKWGHVRGRLFQFGPAFETIFNVLGLIGLLSLILRRQTSYLILTCLPVVAHVFISRYKLYPVDLRLILYQCPIFIILFSFGIKEIVGSLFADLKIERIRILTFVIPVWLGILFFSNGFHATSFPFRRHELKNTIAYVNKNHQPGDGLYVPPVLRNHFEYYWRAKFVKIPAYLIHQGDRHETPDEYALEVSQLHGRQWVISDFYEEEKVMFKLKELGYIPEVQFDDVGARVYLFDLR